MNVTTKADELLEIIRNNYTEETGFPSYAKLTELMGYKSKRSISVLMEHLKEDNRVVTDSHGRIINIGGVLGASKKELLRLFIAGFKLARNSKIEAVDLPVIFETMIN